MLINNYHWIWYLIGFMTCPQLTIMIGLSLYAETLHIPLPLMIIGWVIALFPKNYNKKIKG